MKISKWFQLEREEKVNSFSEVLNEIYEEDIEDVQNMSLWFIDNLTMDEQIRMANREGKSEDYLERLDFFLNVLLEQIIDAAMFMQEGETV